MESRKMFGRVYAIEYLYPRYVPSKAGSSDLIPK